MADLDFGDFPLLARKKQKTAQAAPQTNNNNKPNGTQQPLGQQTATTKGSVNNNNAEKKKIPKAKPDQQVMKKKKRQPKKEEQQEEDGVPTKVVTVKAEQQDDEDVGWDELGLSQWLVKCCAAMGLRQPTPIQRNCIPAILQGRDVIGGAPTGSGKTAAFALPMLHRLAEDPYGVFGLVLTPTRELAYQIAEQFGALGAPLGIKIEVVVGGRDMMRQTTQLTKRPHVVIATPGRLADHINSYGAANFARLRFLVLDEADRLLTNEGLFTSVSSILSSLPSTKSSAVQRQTLLFSATMDFSLQSKIELRDPFSFAVNPGFNTVEKLTQQYIFIPDQVKDCYLVYLLRLEEKDEENEDSDEDPGEAGDKTGYVETSIIVFVSKCETAQLLYEMLRELGIKSVALHSVMTQERRMAALQSFRAGKVKILIATDVASRGLDIPTVELVINFDIPRKIDDYIHRVGRTARAGRGGRAISIITQYDVNRILRIEETIGKKLEEYKTNEDIVLRHVNETATAKRLRESGFEELLKKRKAAASSSNTDQTSEEPAAKPSKKKKHKNKKQRPDS